MLNHNIAAKALLINEQDEVLCLKRRSNDPHSPGTWDFPGGRLNEGEDPFEGLKRECREEVGIDVTVENPLNIHHFTREDGQRITMICFLCRRSDTAQSITLSEEHTEYTWLPPREAKEILHEAFATDVENFVTYFTRDATKWS